MGQVKTHRGRRIQDTGNQKHRTGFKEAVNSAGMTYRQVSFLTGIPYTRLVRIAHDKYCRVHDREREALFSELGVVEDLFYPGQPPTNRIPFGFRLMGGTNGYEALLSAPAASAELESKEIVGLLMRHLRFDRSRDIVASLICGKSVIAIASDYGLSRARVYSIVREEAVRLLKIPQIRELLHSRRSADDAAK